MGFLSGVNKGVDRASVRSSEGCTTNVAAIRSGSKREDMVTHPLRMSNTLQIVEITITVQKYLDTNF